jgi:hypothetical protein
MLAPYRSRARQATAVARRPAPAHRRLGIALTLLLLGALPTPAWPHPVECTPASRVTDATCRGEARSGARSVRPLHDAHLTYSRVVVDGATVIWRVRLFRDDLEKALQAYARNATVRVGSPAADSVFAAYFNAQVPISANGRKLSGRVLQSGRDPEVVDQEMWSFLLDLSPAPTSPAVTTISVRVGLLFEHFADQRNIVTVLKMPGEKRSSLYFVRDDVKEQRLDF